MTVILDKKYPKLNLRRVAVAKINNLIYYYKNKLDIESIHFENDIDGIIYYKLYPYYENSKFELDWYSLSIKPSTLMKVIDTLKNQNFYGFCRTTDGNLIKVKPKKNVQKKL